MLGFFDYTVWLTYISLLSASLGIMVTLNGGGHPYLGVFFLLICGLCDAFDGRVARTKKDRTDIQKNFGIQIDSLSDLAAFGILPACIGNAMIRVCPTIYEIPPIRGGRRIDITMSILFFTIMLVYVLGAMVRLAYFNVMEEERQKTEDGARKYYQGVPVTSAALIFPTVMLAQFLTKADITPVYFVFLLITAIAFVSNIKIPKPGLRGILIMCGIGLVEFIALIVALVMFVGNR
ncbi:MAG: CDP-alcohol phosphatidyltransferase family protein [Saccharofermentans sp.]|nr:CDP-alcohol phosphatidyltransferase family protein [Saccharofermentans sp.]